MDTTNGNMTSPISGSYWAAIIDEQLPTAEYSVGLAEEISQSSGFTVRQIEAYIEGRTS